MQQLIIFIIVGFAAEMIDGTMGMAYGVSSNTFLRSAGVSSVISSACVHIAELFTTLVSGISHLKLKNVSRDLFFKLLIPGILGGILGAYSLVSFESRILDILIDAYLIVMGVIIFSKMFRKQKEAREKLRRRPGPGGRFFRRARRRRLGTCRDLHADCVRARHQKNHRHGQHGRIFCDIGGDHDIRGHDARLSVLRFGYHRTHHRRSRCGPSRCNFMQKNSGAGNAGHYRHAGGFPERGKIDAAHLTRC